MVSALLLLQPLLLAGCGVGGFDLTSIDELRIVAIEADPPEAQPGEPVRATIHVANPDELAVEVMFATCLPYEGGCAEVLAAEEVEQLITLGTLVDGEVDVAREVPSELWDYVEDEDTVLPVRLVALACQVGRCPIFDEVRQAMDQQGLDEGVLEQLLNPEPWLAELPMDIVAVAGRVFPVTPRATDGRNDNPEFDARFAVALEDPMVLPRDAEVDLSFWAADPDGETIYAYPMTTAGSFEERKVKVDNDEVRLYMRTPEQATEGTAWVIFDDRDGGLGVYKQDYVVE